MHPIVLILTEFGFNVGIISVVVQIADCQVFPEYLVFD
jgi:hypothetical protein